MNIERTSLLLFACTLIAMLPLIRVTDASVREEGAADHDIQLVLFYSDDRIVLGRDTEFVVKVHNSSAEQLDIFYGSLGTRIVDSSIRTIKPTGRWYLELVLDIESEIPAMNLSGQSETAPRAEVPVGGHTLVLFTPRSKFLPGERMRIWAELTGPDGEVFRSNEVLVRRVD
jgi:hypothetical protein